MEGFSHLGSMIVVGEQTILISWIGYFNADSTNTYGL